MEQGNEALGTNPVGPDGSGLHSALSAWLMQAPAAIALLHGPEHVIQSVNPRFQEVGGFREMVGKPVREAFPELVGQPLLELVDNAFHSGQPVASQEVQGMPRRDGDSDTLSDVYYDVVCQPISGSSGTIEGLFVMAVDVSGQVLARRQLEQESAARERVQARLAAQREALEMIARGVPLEYALALLTRFIEDEFPEMLCSILLLDEDGQHLRHGAAPSLPEAYNRAIDGIAIGPSVGSCGTAAWRGEPVMVSDIDTDPLWADFRELALQHQLRACWSTPIRGYDGHVLGTFAVYHRQPRHPAAEERGVIDTLTYIASIAIERHRAETELSSTLERERTARAQAEAAVRARDEFLSIAAHELRTPVAAIKGTAQITMRAQARGTLDAARTERALRTINQTCDRLAVLTDDLLDVSRIQGGQLALRPEQTDLAQLAQRVTQRYEEMIEQSHVLDLDLPAAPVVVTADPGRLEQVLDNLLSNAIKYSPAGGAIEVLVDNGSEGVTMVVRDTGIGLPDTMTERIFEPFGRAENAADRGLPGMGLGLFISRRIMELHGGRLSAESDGEGRGTTMRAWLPREND